MKLRKWWKEHQAWDKKRREQEKREQQTRQQKQKALNKLTPKERALLALTNVFDEDEDDGE